MSAGRSATSGTTSAAPIRGCAPSCRRRSIRSRATSTAATSASTSASVLADDGEHRAVVVGVRVHVEQPRVRARAPRRSRRSSPGRGPRRSSARDSSGSTARTLGPVTAEALLVPLARLARARPARLPRLRRGRASARVAARARAAARPARVPLRPGAGIQEGVERRPWRGRAGQTLRRWLELDEDEFYATFHCASVTRCYPGRARVGPRRPHADARGAAALRVLARAGAALLRPRLDRHRRRARGAQPARPRRASRECVGTPLRARRTGAVAIPLPHPSGASSWLNLPENRARVAEAAALVRAELRRLEPGA